MKSQLRRNGFVLVLLIGITLAAIELGNYFAIPHNWLIIFAVIAGLIVAAISLWQYANRQVDGTEWWQDNDASGWRGY
ncbi:MAG: hypothetical protein H6658_17405 [Ardenticatenaceae bacterium]|nr:hypothetical protein [Ardenticatenaceae bacterium]